MGLFDRLVGSNPSLGQQGQQQNRPDPRQGFRQMMNDPAGFFSGITYNGRQIQIPQGMTNGYEIGRYLVESGQISQEMYDMAMQAEKKAPRG